MVAFAADAAAGQRGEGARLEEAVANLYGLTLVDQHSARLPVLNTRCELVTCPPPCATRPARRRSGVPVGATPRHATHAFAMFAATSASSCVLAAPTTSRAAKAGGVRRVAARASASEDKRAPVPIAPSRRVRRGGPRRGGRRAEPRAALAFGNGIPGYDINEKARDAQRKAIKDELGEQKELARIGKGEEASGESRRGSRRGGGAELKRLTDSFRVHEGKRTRKKHKSDRRRLKRVEVQNSHATFVVLRARARLSNARSVAR